ncbi:hypothetical protein PG995_003647 [Apiospora arundinis]
MVDQMQGSNQKVLLSQAIPPVNKPSTVFGSGHYGPAKPVTVPQFNFVAPTSSGWSWPSTGISTQPAAKGSTTCASSDSINTAVTPKPLFGPLSRSKEPQEKEHEFSFVAQGTNTTKPLFGPLSLNFKPPENENNFSSMRQNNKEAITSAVPGHDSQPRGSTDRTVLAPLSLMSAASQFLSQVYGEEVDRPDSMTGNRRKKSCNAPASSNDTTTVPEPSITKRSDGAVSSNHPPRPKAASNSGPPPRTFQSASQKTGASEENKKAGHTTSTSDELNESTVESSDESETSGDLSDEAETHRDYHLKLLTRRPEDDDMMGIMSAPIFTYPVLEHASSIRQGSKSTPFPQYAFLAGSSEEGLGASTNDPRIFYNVASPSSIFICGQQGSGKSHTLSCLLEGCLMPSKLGRLPHPLTGIVFHYDTFVSDASGTPCEAAYLASSANIKVRVLCAPTSIRTMKRTYSKLPGVTVEELRLRESDLNTKRMLDLMQVGGGSMPLYMHVIQRLLRDMRLEQQKTGTDFNYFRFRQGLTREDLTQQQSIPLQQRLDTLESFMVRSQVKPRDTPSKSMKGTFWTPCEGQLTIVDLSCPCVTAEMACSLFNICLSLFLEQPSSIGRVVALDEAHKYMGESAESQTLTNSLLSTIRLQRHLGARVFISTQEPTISPKLLDLCSITIVHHFQSPDWLRVLKGHLAGVSSAIKQQGNSVRPGTTDGDDDADEERALYEGVRGIHISQNDAASDMMSHIVKLRTGDALLFAPSAIVGLEKQKTDGGAVVVTPKQLHHEVMRVRVRARITADGGKSILAT